MTATKSAQAPARGRPPRASFPEPEDGKTKSPLPSGRRPAKDAANVAEYIAAMTAELAAMAGDARLDLLTYFLNMARLEAEFHMRRRE